MKNKNVAALLAFLGGVFGIHRFYLGQIGLGILYCILSLVGISIILGILDGIIFLTMDRDVFDIKYNKSYVYAGYDNNQWAEREQRSQMYEMRDRRGPKKKVRRRHQQESQRSAPPQRNYNRHDPFKQSGIRKFKDFDFEGAIEDFQQSLKINPNDVSVHFNLACSYSQLEKTGKGFSHLSRAVKLGFNDYQKINNHDALAYLRIQPGWNEFKTNQYQLEEQEKVVETNLLEDDLLLAQLRKLNELKESGLITEIEFAEQRKKIIN